MFGAGVAVQPARCLRPVGEGGLALVVAQAIITAAGVQPVLKRQVSVAIHAAAEVGLKIVIRGAGAQYQQASIAQRRQRPAHLNMGGAVQAAQQRQLHHGNIRLGVHQLQRHEHAVVKAAAVIEVRRKPRTDQGALHITGQGGLAGCRICNVVGLLRKAAVVIDQLRAGGAGNARFAGFPVGADQQNGLGARQLFSQVAQKLTEPGMTGVIQQRQGAATVGNKQNTCAACITH